MDGKRAALCNNAAMHMSLSFGFSPLRFVSFTPKLLKSSVFLHILLIPGSERTAPLFLLRSELTVVGLRLPVVLRVGEGEGRVGAAGQTGALLGLQTAHPHVLQAVSGRRVHLRLRVHVGPDAERVAATVDVSRRSGAQCFLLLFLMLPRLLLRLLLVDVVVGAPDLPSFAEV